MSSIASRPDAGFTQFELPENLQSGISELRFAQPRPIQSATIPAALEGRDVLGLAQTGTGKTAAFALPLAARLLAVRRPGPRVLIIAPTRELAMQIHAEVEALTAFTPLKAATIFGGVPAGPQIRALRGRPDILIACPGRLLDLHQQGHVDLDRMESLVLDEADHLFDMGFLPDVRRILSLLPSKRQNLMFSATMPKEIRVLAAQVLRNPHVAEIAHSAPAPTIEHALYVVAAARKLELLHHLLADGEFTSGIVFLRTKHRAKRVAEQLNRAGHRAVSLEGNMTQAQRDRAMGGFRNGRFNVLVATDIAARGIDVAKISHVINFDVPATPDSYTHRVGRTGRAEESGRAYTFAAGDELSAVHAIERKLGSKISRRNVPALEKLPVNPVETRERPAEAQPRSRRRPAREAPRSDAAGPHHRPRRRFRRRRPAAVR